MPDPTEADIRARAYELWDRNGRPDGREIDYWLQAARELEEEERLAARGASHVPTSDLDIEDDLPAPDGDEDVPSVLRPRKPTGNARAGQRRAGN